MVLILLQNQMDSVILHAEKIYPEECCGLLLGALETGDDRRWVKELRPLTNEWTTEVNPFLRSGAPEGTHSKQNRYWIDPTDLMAAQRYCRDRSWIVLGVYHSHPDHPAVPSERDRQLAWCEYSYPILSVRAGHVADISSWRLGETGDFQREVIEIL